MQAELNATANLLARADQKLKKLADLDKEVDLAERTVRCELTQLKYATQEVSAAATAISDRHYDIV